MGTFPVVGAEVFPAAMLENFSEYSRLADASTENFIKLG